MSLESAPVVQLYNYTRAHRFALLLATICSILNKIFDLAPPFLIGAAVDIAVNGSHSIFADFGFKDPITQLYVLGGLTLIIWFLESLFQYLYQILWRNLSQTIEHSLRLNAYNHLQDLDLEFFEDRQSGGLMAILNNDINQLERFLDIGANDLIQVAVTVIVI